MKPNDSPNKLRAAGQLDWNEKTVKSPVEIWGLTGGIASGKSTAGRFFEEAGFPLIDADKLARDLSAPGGAAYNSIIKRFKTADRGAIKDLVFRDPAARRDLEAILHPLIQAESMRRIKAIADQWRGPLKELRVIYEAALLVETGRYKTLAGLIVIESPKEIRKQRMIARDGLDEASAERILASQTSDEARRQAATSVILNDGTLEDLRAHVLEFISKRGWKPQTRPN